MKKRILLVVALACLPVLIGGTVVLAGRNKPSRPNTRSVNDGGGLQASGTAAAAASALNGQAGSGCRLGVDTDEDPVVPLATGSIVSRVRISKPCPGVVVGQFTTETALEGMDPGPGELFFRAEARCVQTGGFSSPCTVGETELASPGEVFLDSDVQPDIETRAMNVVWPNLRRGVWLFYVEITGDGQNALILRRTFHVEAFEGGPAIQPQ